MLTEQAVPNDESKRERLTVEGAVQGVGFRPFVYRLARKFGLTGYVQNSSAGVVIEIEGSSQLLVSFKQALRRQERLPQARIHRLDCKPIKADGLPGFAIRPSATGTRPTAVILPDLAVCADCLQEMNDRSDRRYRYPFINCSHCGPRYSIVTALPYDRPNTTMAGFDMCAACRAEYDDPDDRRHHAQPIACPDCGPQLELRDVNGGTGARGDQALREAAVAVRNGAILAIKGLGGFHLICDARNPTAVAELRRRKQRPLKPLAVMYPTLRAVKGDCVVVDQEARLLSSAQSPIVLLRTKRTPDLADNLAPGNPYLGVLLPSTPLHHVLMSELGFPVVATSGNRVDEPICISEDRCVRQLEGIADVFLVHDRPISGRCDDSIVRIMAGAETILRRARGYAPLPIVIDHPFAEPVLAVGGHLKNTVALAVRDRVFLSPHIGDLSTPESCAAHRQAVELLCGLYQADPVTVAHDLHPDYRSTRTALTHHGKVVGVQHHYAHALACMAENNVHPPCLAVTWDGTGYGSDGTLWGGEFLALKPGGFERALHMLPFPLPGGDAAALDPKRAALGMLYALEGEDAFGRALGLRCEDVPLMKAALGKGINCPLTSSVGRMYDAVAALTGICSENSYEGQAAMALEFAADGYPLAAYAFEIDNRVIDWRPMLREILRDVGSGVAPGAVSARFHASLVAIIVAAAKLIDEQTLLLSGGCFQNALLVEHAIDALESAGFSVCTHRQVPPNDGGLALGQIMAMAPAL